MIEAAIPMGPMGSGPARFASIGQIRTPDCASYNSSLAFAAITGMFPELTAKAVESDVVSQILEHQLQRPVNFVDFFIRDAEITDASGKKVRKKALFSPDFGKSIQDVTNMEEKDGQVWEVTNRLSDRVVNSNGESWHLLASPGEEQSDDHRLILIHNRGDGRAREYFVTIRSSRTALEKVVENLSDHNFAGNEDISTVIISREKNKEEPPITLRDIFDQFTCVLDDKERKERRSFLQELKRDAYSTKEELEKRNSRAQRLVETQIKEIFTDKPSLEALGLVAQSIPGWAKMVEETTNYTVNEPPLTPTATFRLIRDTPETGLEKTPTQDIKLTRLDQQFAKQVIEPIVPILLALVGEIANCAEDDLIINVSTVRNDQLSPQLIVSQNQPPKNKIYYDNIYYLSESEKKASWQGIIAEILMFSREEATDGQAKEVTYHQKSQQQGFDESGHSTYGSLQSLRHPGGDRVRRGLPWSVKSGNPLMMGILEDANWSLLNLLPIKIKEDEESAGAIYNESRATIIADFQKALEYIADLDPEITSRLIGKKEAALEEEVVNLGRQMLGTAFEGVSFLLAVYDDENTCKSVKHILAALIYREIKQVGKDKSLPKPSSFEEQLSRLSQNAASLEKRFGILKKVVSRLLMLNIPDDYLFDTFDGAWFDFAHHPELVEGKLCPLGQSKQAPLSMASTELSRMANPEHTPAFKPESRRIDETFEYASHNILLMIFCLDRFIEQQKSAERLSNTGRMKQTAFMPRVSKSKKKLPLAGIIYSFSYQVIYQYRPLVIGKSDMTQYE